MVVRYNNMPNRQNFRSGIKVRSQIRAGFGMGFGVGAGWSFDRSTADKVQPVTPTDDKAESNDLPDWDV